MSEVISIIIPVYNVELYLKKCIDSVINQTYQNLDIIIIDDGSKDLCPEICDEYARRDSRIRVIHQQNSGQGKARNVGLDIAKGEYIAFLDSDDFLDHNYIEQLYLKAKETESDIVICNYRHVDENNQILSGGPRSKIIEKTYTGNEAMRVALYWKEYGVAPWAKLFHVSTWQGVRFKEGRIYEDLATTYLVYFNAKRVCFTNEYLMYYRIRSNSDIHQAFNIKKAQILDSADEILDFCIEKAPQCVRAAESRQIASACFIYFRIPDDEVDKFSEIVVKCQKIIKKYRRHVMWDKNARLKTRVGAFLSLFGFGFERKIFSKLVK